MTISPLSSPQKIRKNRFPRQEEVVSEHGKRVSEAVYWATYYEHEYFSYEWVNGVLEERPMSDFLNYAVYMWFISLLRQFLEIHPMARAIALETGFKLKVPQEKSVRKPDLGIVLNSNPVPLGDKDRSYKGIFDLCIESLSDSNKRAIERDTVTKKRAYAKAGVQEYFILDQSGRNTRFYRLGSRGVYLPIEPIDGVIQSSVLTGFQFRIADLYK